VVRSVERLTPRFVRVAVEGDLAGWPEPGAAAHTKLFVPADGEGVMRTYTVRAWDLAAGSAVFDVYLHPGNGPAARWADAVAPGDRLELGGRNRSTFAPADDARTYLLAGDPSALPAIATCLEVLPAGARATVVAAVPEAADELPLASAAELDVRWLRAPDDDAFVAAVEDVEADRYWIACEATLMRRLRHALLERAPREAVSTRGYWKRGEANHPDHDTGEDG
jgi:NADPH-dependent ferric siderophore reductase